MRAIRVLGITLLTAVSLRAECAVNVTLVSGNFARAAAVIKAKSVAVDIFAGIGMELGWSKAATDGRRCITRIEARLEIASAASIPMPWPTPPWE